MFEKSEDTDMKNFQDCVYPLAEFVQRATEATSLYIEGPEEYPDDLAGLISRGRDLLDLIELAFDDEFQAENKRAVGLIMQYARLIMNEPEPRM